MSNRHVEALKSAAVVLAECYDAHPPIPQSIRLAEIRVREWAIQTGAWIRAADSDPELEALLQCADAYRDSCTPPFPRPILAKVDASEKAVLDAALAYGRKVRKGKRS